MSVLQVVERIITLREQGLKDSVICKNIQDEFSNKIKLTFAFCEDVDRHFGRTTGGGYWREAYNWPNKGDICDIPIMDDNYEPEEIIDCGFFTFNVKDYI